jgi:hypothetical protein
MRTVWSDWLVVAGQAAVCVTFVVAAASKTVRAGAFGDFKAALPRMLGVPHRVAPAAALAVVVLEVTIALTVAVPALALAAFLLAGVLMAVFTVSIVVMIRRGSVEPCHCFGMSARPPGRSDVVRNLVLLVISVIGAVGAATSSGAADLPAAGVVLCAAVGAVVALLLINLAEIGDLLKPASTSRS